MVTKFKKNIYNFCMQATIFTFMYEVMYPFPLNQFLNQEFLQKFVKSPKPD